MYIFDGRNWTNLDGDLNILQSWTKKSDINLSAQNDEGDVEPEKKKKNNNTPRTNFICSSRSLYTLHSAPHTFSFWPKTLSIKRSASDDFFMNVHCTFETGTIKIVVFVIVTLPFFVWLLTSISMISLLLVQCCCWFYLNLFSSVWNGAAQLFRILRFDVSISKHVSLKMSQ